MKRKQLSVYLTILMFILLWASCINKQKREIISLVEHWKNKEILFPVTSIFTQNKDTVEFSLEAPYKILSYVDSTGCVSCKLKLTEWKNFISVLDSVNPSAKVLFYFSPEKIADVYRALRQSYFDYPVCIDMKDSLDILNHFPSNMEFQTFLLDKDNKVIAMGNPIHNSKVKELYLKIIQGEKVERQKENEVIKTKVNVDRTSISLGNFNWQKEQKVTFTLTNTGNKPLVIQGVNTSCGCTSVAYSKEPVMPGEEIALDVTYKADHPEHFSKTITVYCNSDISPIKLSISGDAE